MTFLFIILISAGDIVFGACGDKPGANEDLNDSLGLEFSSVDIWWTECFHGTSYQSLANQVKSGIATRHQKGYELIAFRLGEGTTDSISLFTRNIFGYDELHPGNPNKYDALAHRALGVVMETNLWPPFDTYGPDEPPNPDSTYWAESCDSFMNYLRDTIHYFRIWNEPDAFRRHVLRDYYEVFVLNTDSSDDWDSLGYIIDSTTHNGEKWKVVAWRGYDPTDSTTVGVIKFRFYKWNPDEGWLTDSVFQETLRVSVSLETWIKETAWTPAYFVQYFQKPAYLKAKAYNQNIKVVMVPMTLWFYKREALFEDMSYWIRQEMWPQPNLIIDPHHQGLINWLDEAFWANGFDYCDAVFYDFNLSWIGWTGTDFQFVPTAREPWHLIPGAVDSLVSFHMRYDIDKQILIIAHGTEKMSVFRVDPFHYLKVKYIP